MQDCTTSRARGRFSNNCPYKLFKLMGLKYFRRCTSPTTVSRQICDGMRQIAMIYDALRRATVLMVTKCITIMDVFSQVTNK